MISVFRIYLGQAWIASGRDKALVAHLDTLPDFFYRVSRPPEDADATSGSALERRAIARIGMTHAHVLVLPADASLIAPNWSGVELEIALTGLRQRIPIVAIYGSGEAQQETLITRAADATSAWDAKDIGCAILQVVETEAIARRKRIAQLDAVTDMVMHRDAIGHDHKASRPSAAGAARTLPVEAITKAYTAFKSSTSKT